MDKGYLIVRVYSSTLANPINNAKVTILKDDIEIATIYTLEDGKTNTITLDTVSSEYSNEEQYEIRPYEVYDVIVEALGLTKTRINNVQIFPNITSIQDVYMTSIDENDNTETDTIMPNNLWENNDEEKELPTTYEDYGISLLVLRSVEVPETIIVHDGNPSDTSKNYTVNFTDYIKNVASSEIYSTWPDASLRANILAIISFTLNRLYTEWYPSRGYDFDITSTTSYDQKYTRNGTIFENISKIVDEIFNQYIREGIRLEPLLAHYKSNTTEEGYMSQWGSKYLADKGYTTIQILKFYYGDDIEISTADIVTGDLTSYNGDLKLGDCNSDVYFIENLLNYIHGSYSGIPLIEEPSGLFDENVEESVKTFQNVFNLDETGIIDFATWYKISKIYVAVAKLTNSIYE